MGNRKVKSITENMAELKPFIQNQAEMVLQDMRFATKGGEVSINHETGERFATSRLANETFEIIQAQTGKSYKEIEEAKKAGKFYILPGMEGLSGIGTDLDKIDELYDFGVRHAMLTWNEQNELATGAKADPNRGLTELGRKAVRKIHDKHMIMDISHANERTFWDIAKVGGGPLMASHSNVWELRNHVRNLTDCQLLEIRDTKGIVGLNAFNELIADNREDRTVEGLIRHADYIANKIGVEHLALGFDFCEFLGDEAAGAFAEAGSINAIGLDDASHTPFMIEKMKEAGFSEKELEMICTGNWFELIKRVVG
jgi:membrane dipeptidase